ncbi:hypothetical protein PF007_g27980 [Phytophthora fragariae]|uniref:Uncharacterized protein n=1 Tax=Phytophthora fragariae TaxID=53985 RepID=A0A6A3Q315_9STRA|nr:hypothetical protein PF007_g27980 [Phytophthora fragariae]
MAAKVICQGTHSLANDMEVQQVLLRITTLDKTLRKQVDQEGSEVDELRHTLNNFFGILWEQPTQNRLQAAKFLANRKDNQHYDLRKPHLSALKESILKMVPQYSPDIAAPIRQTADIVSRLTTYFLWLEMITGSHYAR